MKNEQIQEFRSLNLLSLISLVVLSLSIIATPWNRNSEDYQSQVARQKAEVVGYQVIQLYRESIKASLSSVQSKSSRNVASISSLNGVNSKDVRIVGTMGVDPWGQPFHFRLLPPDKQSAVRILVWSAGPNKFIETKELGNEEVALIGQPSYSGDDVGVILSMSQY